MHSIARRMVVLVAALLITGGLAAGVPAETRATSTSPAVHGLGQPATSAPVDQSRIWFKAFRSHDYAFVPGAPFYLEVTKWSVPTGPMHFAELVDGAEVDLGVPTWAWGATVNGVTAYIGHLLLPGTTAGTHTYLAVFEGTAEWDPLTLSIDVEVGRVPTTVTIETSSNVVQTQHPINLFAILHTAGAGMPMTGTIEWRDLDADIVLGTHSIDELPFTFSSPVGVRHLTASYSGDDFHAPSTSDVFVLTVIPDYVEASSVGAQYGTFYPVTDGYRDAVAIKGTRSEPIAVSIAIYSPTGSVVRSASIVRASGAYSYGWNGRNSAGTILASGRYKVVQTLTDAAGKKKAFTDYVTLSPKKLVTSTKYVEKAGSSVAATGAGDGGAVSTSSAGGYAKLNAGNGWALAGWDIPIPTATVYKSISFEVYGKVHMSAPGTQLGIQYYAKWDRTNDTWYDSDFGNWKMIGNSTGGLAWFSTSGTLPSGKRSVRTIHSVRGMIEVPYGTVYIYKVRAKVVCSVLQ